MDPNRNRDQALADIARLLKSIDNSLKDIAKSAKYTSGRVLFTNYIERGENDGATTPAGSAKTDYLGPGPYSE
jgi:hypothetical protein